MNPPDPARRYDTVPAKAALLEPTGARHWVLAFASTLAVITYLEPGEAAGLPAARAA